MQPLVGPMSDQDLRDSAAYYAHVGNQPLQSTPTPVTRDSQVVQQGERLYLTGDAARGIPPCQGCHGEQALGHPAVDTAGSPAVYRMYPPLRGQHFEYLVAKLKEYRDGKLMRSSTDYIMTGVARTLDDESIEALAAWLNAQPLR